MHTLIIALVIIAAACALGVFMLNTYSQTMQQAESMPGFVRGPR